MGCGLACAGQSFYDDCYWRLYLRSHLIRGHEGMKRPELLTLFVCVMVAGVGSFLAGCWFSADTKAPRSQSSTPPLVETGAAERRTRGTETLRRALSLTRDGRQPIETPDSISNLYARDANQADVIYRLAMQVQEIEAELKTRSP